MPSIDDTSARRRTVPAHACPACEQPWAVRATRNPDGLFLLVCRFCEWHEVRRPAAARLAPAPCAAVAQEGQHVVLFHDDDEQLLSRLTDVVAVALAGGASCLVIATDAHRSRLVERLGERASGGGLVLLDAEEILALFLRDGRPDPALFDASVGALVRDQAEAGRPVQAFGEMVALLRQRGAIEAALELEVLWDRLVGQVGLSLLCAYPATIVDRVTDGRARVCRHHTAVAA